MDRKIIGNIREYDKNIKENPEKTLGVYANEENNQKISDIFKNDLQSLIRSSQPQIRILLGDNGTGKSTHLEYFKQLLDSYYHNIYFFFEIDLRHIAEKTEQGLWLAIFNQIYESLSKRIDVIEILKNYDVRSLRKIFKNSTIAENLKNFGQDPSEKYFYSEEFQNISKIQAFFNGIIDILMENKILTIIAIDEVQQIEKWGEPVFQAFLESFVSSTYDRYMRSSMDARLFFILSFLIKSPASREDKYTFLEKYSPGFVSRMKGREIMFQNFTEKEHKDALKLCADITNLNSQERKKFEAETKSKLTYWMTRNNPREFGKYIQEIYKKQGLLEFTPSEKRQIYEKEGRDYIKTLLEERGFTYIADQPEKVEGYNIDVYAETKHRTIIKKCAFGEIKTTQRKSLKRQVETFSNWLKVIKNTTLYNHADNYYFFISPYDPTSATQEILDQYSIDWIKFRPPLFEEGDEDEGNGDITEETTLSSLNISGLAQTRLGHLKKKGIIKIKDLKEANLGVLASSIKGISKNMLLNWKSECEKRINP